MKRDLILKQYNAIKAYRKSEPAPVDSYGCEAHFQNSHKDPNEERFRLLVSLLLSVQTNDIITDKVFRRLSEEGLSRKSISSLKIDELQDKISNVNYSAKKAVYIHEIAIKTLDKTMPEEWVKKHRRCHEIQWCWTKNR